MSTFYGLLVAAGALTFGYLIASRLLGKSRELCFWLGLQPSLAWWVTH